MTDEFFDWFKESLYTTYLILESGYLRGDGCRVGLVLHKQFALYRGNLQRRYIYGMHGAVAMKPVWEWVG